MKERVDSYPERQKLLEQMKYEQEYEERGKREHIQITKGGKEAYTPYINEEADLPTIHEAYQYLVKTYVENVILRKTQKKNVMKKSKAINAFIGNKSGNEGKNSDIFFHFIHVLHKIHILCEFTGFHIFEPRLE